ncbi:DsbA family protein [Natronomonas salsuginis]|jgi:protein-disulfide isomerase|uniref:DsbA family protein n=1 Tax=Natronomonas salsuginis TaxID=2217661 RepID=A0A4U5JIC8_9EURY|nr:thioredoxin domain-containing protein [Natronomonas salsuginis]TKR28111.1 DsbA family protein [Natronomonas salsuginis]
MKRSRGTTRLSRRRLLQTGALLGVSGIAGCLGGGNGGTGNGEQETTERPTLGDSDAPVTVAVYEDFACPHCRTFNEDVTPQLVSEYVEPGDVAYEHYDFPIPVDETVSWQAPQAARSVMKQAGSETFFEYSELLFANQGSLGMETYVDLAAEVGVDGDVVESAVSEGRYRQTVETDRDNGIDRGVGGTPTVFVNGENPAPDGRLGYSGIVQAIESQL